MPTTKISKSKKSSKKTNKRSTKKKSTKRYTKKITVGETPVTYKLHCNIVTLDEFKTYLDERKLNYISITNIKLKKNGAILLKTNRFTTYTPFIDNNQFIKSYNDVDYIKNKLLIMLKNMLCASEMHDIESMLIQQATDVDILSYIKYAKKIWDILPDTKKSFKTVKNQNQQKSTVCQNSKEPKTPHDIIIKYMHSNVNNPTILDVGCGDANKIKKIKTDIKKYYNKNVDIIGADIQSWGPYTGEYFDGDVKKYEDTREKKYDIVFKLITIDPYRIDFKDNSFDCITLMLALHHCQDIVAVIVECKRILKTDGIIYLNEHDVWTDSENIIIDLQHSIMGVVHDGTIHGSVISGSHLIPRSCYYNCVEWDIIFDRCGMIKVFSDGVFKNGIARYDMQFISVYKCKT